MSMRPVVDGLERRLRGRVDLLRIDVHGAGGREIAARWGVEVVPTFLLLSGAGRELLRCVGRPPSARRVLSALASAGW